MAALGRDREDLVGWVSPGPALPAPEREESRALLVGPADEHSAGAGLVAREGDDQFGDLAYRNEPAYLLRPLRRRHRLDRTRHRLRRDPVRADARDADVVALAQRAERGGQCDHARLRCRVLRRVVGLVDETSDGRDVDDRTAPAPAHRLEHRLDSEHDAVEVDLEGAAPMLRRSVRVARRAEPACVVDEDVDAAERLLAEGDEGTPTVAVGGVGTEHPGAAAVTLDLPN